ncbi:MAG: hypothetical protein AAFN74_18010 [Myxococcota bacterium]
MIEFQDIVQVICDRVPEVIGAVLCDQQGETIVSAMGRSEVPPEANERAKEHVPHTMDLDMPVNEFLVRLAGAEPCGLVRQIQAAQNERAAGTLDAYVARYAEVDLIVEQLPEDLYLFVALRRPASIGAARRFTRIAARELEPFLE